MENNAILEQIKANGMKNFKAVNIGDSTTVTYSYMPAIKNATAGVSTKNSF